MQTYLMAHLNSQINKSTNSEIQKIQEQKKT